MRKFLNAVWIGLKVLVSLAALLMGVGVFVAAVQAGEIATAFPWGALAVFTFIAAAPWIFGKEKPSRAFGLAAIFSGIGVIYFGFSVAYVPEDCSQVRSRGRLACYALNWLFEVGGQHAVTGFWFAIGAFLLVGGYKSIKRRLYYA